MYNIFVEKQRPQETPASVDAELDEMHKLNSPKGASYWRLCAFAVIAVTLPVIFIASRLEPDTRGYDTHTGLGWPGCGFVQRYGKPCPTCGMTTAFSNLAHGKIFSALKSQIFGSLLAAATFFYFAIACLQLIIGKNLLWSVRPRKNWIWPAAILFVAAWGIKTIQML